MQFGYTSSAPHAPCSPCHRCRPCGLRRANMSTHQIAPYLVPGARRRKTTRSTTGLRYNSKQSTRPEFLEAAYCLLNTLGTGDNSPGRSCFRDARLALTRPFRVGSLPFHQLVFRNMVSICRIKLARKIAPTGPGSRLPGRSRVGHQAGRRFAVTARSQPPHSLKYGHAFNDTAAPLPLACRWRRRQTAAQCPTVCASATEWLQ